MFTHGDPLSTLKIENESQGPSAMEGVPLRGEKVIPQTPPPTVFSSQKKAIGRHVNLLCLLQADLPTAATLCSVKEPPLPSRVSDELESYTALCSTKGLL